MESMILLKDVPVGAPPSLTLVHIDNHGETEPKLRHLLPQQDMTT